MSGPAMSDAGWMAAKGEEAGQPVLLRIRDLSLDTLPKRRYPHLLATTWCFDASRESGLPSTEQYKVIEKYEEHALELLESNGHGFLVIVRTHGGRIEHIMYVDDVDTCIDAIERDAPNGMELEFSVNQNDDWDEYRTAREALT